MDFNGFENIFDIDLKLFAILFLSIIVFDIVTSLIFKDKNNDKISLSEEEQKLIAWHEAGHTLAAKRFNFPLIKTNLYIESKIDYINLGVTIIENDNFITNKESLENMIKLYYSGRIGEVIFLKGDDSKITSTCSNDIDASTNLIEQYYQEYGFSDKYKLFSLNSLEIRNNIDLINDYLLFSETLYNEMNNYLKKHEKCLEMIANDLLIKKELSNKEVENIISIYEKENNLKI